MTDSPKIVAVQPKPGQVEPVGKHAEKATQLPQTWGKAKDLLATRAPSRATRTALKAIPLFENAEIPLHDLPPDVAAWIMNARHESIMKFLTSWGEFIEEQAILGKEAADRVQLMATQLKQVVKANHIKQPLRGELLQVVNGVLRSNAAGSSGLNSTSTELPLVANPNAGFSSPISRPHTGVPLGIKAGEIDASEKGPFRPARDNVKVILK